MPLYVNYFFVIKDSVMIDYKHTAKTYFQNFFIHVQANFM